MAETMELARFVEKLDIQDVPHSVVHEAKRALIDWLAVAVTGSAEPSTDILCSVVAQFGSVPQATVVGRRERFGAPFAALINGFASHLQDYDDTYNPGQTTVHGSAPVWPAILAASELRSVDGSRALEAFIAGFETETRVARAAGPEHYELGWHVTGTVGHLGAAAATAKVLGLTADGVAQALGCAGTQAAGVKEVYGTDCKALHAGKAAMDGLLAAQLIAARFTSTTSILEGAHGFLQVFSPRPQASALTDGLGTTWHLSENGYKLYPSGSLTHPTIDALLALRTRHSFSVDQIAEITAEVHPYAATVTGKTNPRSGLEAKFSLHYCVAVTLVHGRPILGHFSDSAIHDPRLATLQSNVRVIADETVGKRGSRATVRLKTGDVFTEAVHDNRGTPRNPLSDDDLEAKFLDIVSPRLGQREARDLLDYCWRADRLSDFSAIGLACGAAI